MFERFTEKARRVVVLAQEEARLLNHNYIGTEHILLGLLRETEGVAAEALESLGFTLEAVRERVGQKVGRGARRPSGHIPFTPRAKKVLELSLREALQLDHNYIGTEHILLGLIREGEGAAAQIMTDVAGDLGRVRERVEEMLPPGQAGQAGRAGQAAGPGPGRAEAAFTARSWRKDFRDAVSSIEARLDAIERHLGLHGAAEPPGDDSP
jgi:ATP-dependent Clp protease ATP-binding subunit ClpC